MRLLNIDTQYSPIIQDLLKTATILIVVEMIQYFVLNQPLFDISFTRTAIQQLIGIVVFYLVVDGVVGAGPECCNIPKLIKDNKSE
jgi:hypothetical protein